MKFVLHTNSVSPHQLPLAKEIVKRIGADAYRYIYTDKRTDERKQLGWIDEKAEWIICEKDEPEICRKLIENCDVLMSGIREIHLFELRSRAGLKTIYTSERWFKPWVGFFRLLNISYFKMAKQFVRLLIGNEHFWYYPMGIHAARDMARLCGLMTGDLRCLFRAPKLDFEKKPGGRVWLRNKSLNTRKYGLDKMRIWGYFVESSRVSVNKKGLLGNSLELGKTEFDNESGIQVPELIRVLWVGRLLKWKCVDTIIRAVVNSDNTRLDIYGMGAEEERLKKLAEGFGGKIKFHPQVPIYEVRRLMREHDVYVLSSNGYEGWGAVVNEALEEGMKVLGTYEAGASATILPDRSLFHAGDWHRLKVLLESAIEDVDMDFWKVESSVQYLVS